MVYQLDTDAMKGLVRNAINEKGLINREELRKSCRNYYQFENMGKLPTTYLSKTTRLFKTAGRGYFEMG